MPNRQATIPGSSGGLPVTFTQTINVCPGQAYILSAFGAASGGTVCYLQLCVDNTCATALNLGTAYSEDDYFFNGGSNGTAVITVSVYCTGGNTRTVFLDSVSVRAS